MLLANSGGPSVVTLTLVLILTIDELADVLDYALGPEAPAATHAAQAHPPQVPMPQLFNAGDPAGAPFLTQKETAIGI
jgi:hypothetical protein